MEENKEPEPTEIKQYFDVQNPAHNNQVIIEDTKRGLVIQLSSSNDSIGDLISYALAIKQQYSENGNSDKPIGVG